MEPASEQGGTPPADLDEPPGPHPSHPSHPSHLSHPSAEPAPSVDLMSFALDQAREAIFLIERSGRFHFANNEACRILGYSRPELLRLRVSDIDPDYPRGRWRGHWEELQARGSLSFETRHRTKGGRVFPVEVNASFIDYGGQVYNMALVRDITLRKGLERERQDHLWYLENLDRINQTMRRAEELEPMLNQVVEETLAIFNCDRACLVHPLKRGVHSWQISIEKTRQGSSCAPKQMLLADTQVVDLLAKNPGCALQLPLDPHETGPGLSQELREKRQSALLMAINPKVGEPYGFVLHQEGSPRSWSATEASLFQEIGRRLGDTVTSLLSARDQRDTMAKLQEAQRIAAIGYWEWEAPKALIILSSEASRIFGIAEKETVLSVDEWHARWLELVHPEDRNRVSEAIWKARRGESDYRQEYRIVFPGGTTRHVHSEANVTRSHSGNPTRMLGMVQDITCRKKAEQQLYASEQMFRALVENTPDIIVRFDAQCRRLYVNPAMEKELGVHPKYLLGSTPLDTLFADSPEALAAAEKIQDAIIHVLQTGEYFQTDLIWGAPNGHRHVFNTRYAPEFDPQGRVTSVVSISRDITKRIRAEEEIRRLNAELELRVAQRTQKLAESESSFRFLYNTAPVSICEEDWSEVIALVRGLQAKGVKDLKAFFTRHPAFAASALRAVKILDFNQWTLGMFEARDKQELLEAAAAVFSTPEAIAGFVEELAALGQGQTHFQTEMRINTLRGNSFHALVTSSFPSPESDSGYVLVSAIDITERKRFEQELQRSEERLRLFFERQVVGMAFSSPEKGWLKVNEKLCEMLGYSREEISTMTWAELTHPEDLPADLAQYERLLKGEIDSYMLEKRFVRKDGSVLFTYLSVASVRRANGSLDYVLAILEDITQRKEAERKAEEALRKEIVLRREIHHRVKNNLQVIISLLYLQSTKVTDPATRALFAESQMRVRSIALVHEMLYQRQDLSQIAFADYVRQLASEIFFAFRVSLSTIDLKVSSQKAFLDIGKAIPCGIIVAELITNCLKYAFPNEAKGRIEVSLQPGPGTGSMELTVEDDGIGLPENLDAKRSQTMGLSLVHDLTRQLGGTVDFRRPESGQGTRVTITFPAED